MGEQEVYTPDEGLSYEQLSLELEHLGNETKQKWELSRVAFGTKGYFFKKWYYDSNNRRLSITLYKNDSDEDKIVINYKIAPLPKEKTNVHGEKLPEATA